MAKLLALALGLAFATAANATNMDDLAALSERPPLGPLLPDTGAARSPLLIGAPSPSFGDIAESAVALPTPLSLDYSVVLARNASLAANRTGPLITVLATPEPTSWTMILLGFGLLGMMMRRSSPPASRA